MRVIAGEFRSRVLATPRGMATRPTSDRLRETLFNVLGPAVVGARFLDLYAGSGAVGIEALSRGAAHALLVEAARPALAALRSNLETLQLKARATVDPRPVAQALRAMRQAGKPAGLVFLDPPYEAAQEYEETLRILAEANSSLLAPGALVIAEHARKRPLPERFAGLVRTRLLEQGDAALSFYRVREEGAAEKAIE